MDFVALRDRLSELDSKTWRAIRKAARRGEAEAQYLLGIRFNWASLGFKDCEKWLIAAADQDHPEAVRELAQTDFPRWTGKGVHRSDQECRELLTRAAELGSAQARRDLAVRFAHGEHGYELDWTKVRYWYGRAVELGEQESHVALGSMMVEGDGGPVDLAGGLALLETSATGPEWEWAMRAAGQLARYYSGAYGVPEDLAKAEQWRRVELPLREKWEELMKRRRQAALRRGFASGHMSVSGD